MSPSVVLIDVGTNELSSPSLNPGRLACEIGELACRFRQLPSVETVVIMPILPCAVVNCLYPTRPDFNDARLVVSRAVTDICKHLPRVYTWRCFRLHPERFLSKDGIHPNFLEWENTWTKCAEHPCLAPGVVRRKFRTKRIFLGPTPTAHFRANHIRRVILLLFTSFFNGVLVKPCIYLDSFLGRLLPSRRYGRKEKVI